MNELVGARHGFVPSIAQVIYLMVLGATFLHFLIFGGRTFKTSPLGEIGSAWGQFSFLITGTVGTWWLGSFWPIHLYNGIASAILLLLSLMLYEWSRRVISGNGLWIAWSDEVPDRVIEEGPYAYIRHPIYASYLLAFLATWVALAKTQALVLFLFNVVLFTHAAITDERNLAQSPLAAKYEAYKRRAGRFFPRLTTARA